MELHDEIMKGQIDEMLHHAFVIGDDAFIQKAFSDMIEKGATANIGEERIWSGVKYRKESAGKWIEVTPIRGMGGPEHSNVGKTKDKPSFESEMDRARSPKVVELPEPKIRAERAKLDEGEKVMPRAKYDSTIRSLFTRGEASGDSYDNARTLFQAYPQLVNRLKRDYPGYSKKELLEQLQYDIEGMDPNN
jgi:hypothetical protein